MPFAMSLTKIDFFSFCRIPVVAYFASGILLHLSKPLLLIQKYEIQAVHLLIFYKTWKGDGFNIQ